MLLLHFLNQRSSFNLLRQEQLPPYCRHVGLVLSPDPGSARGSGTRLVSWDGSLEWDRSSGRVEGVMQTVKQ